MELGLKGKVALVTGGARGIGAAIAKTLASEGASVAITDINDEVGNKTAQELSKISPAFYANMNVANMESVETASKKIIEHFGKIDILVNNAGITKDGLIMRMKEADWDLVININLKGAFNCCKILGTHMMKNRTGRIINIASVVGQMGNAGQVNYSASKAGMIGITKTLAKEFASRNVTVNAIAPGFIKSDMTDVLSEEVRTNFLSAIPLGTFGLPEDIANMVCYLASDKGSYITGQVMAINGGMYV
jgi:3-oxoacyl-[acyl-carrier protein] reductase